MNMIITNYNSTEDMINKLQSLKGKTKLEFYKNISNYYTEMKNKNFQTQEDPFSKKAQGISKIYHRVLLVMNFLQSKPIVKNMNNNYHDLFYTVIKNREDKFENKEDDYNNFHDFITPNHFIGINPRETILR